MKLKVLATIILAYSISVNAQETDNRLSPEEFANGWELLFDGSTLDGWRSYDNENEIGKLFIVQFEGFLPSNNLVYNYNFDNATPIGGNKYRLNTWYYDAVQLAQENPLGEGAKTQTFLKSKGLSFEDQFMMSRFVGLASDDRKNEIIIFYHEMLNKSTGYSLDEWENSVSRDEVLSIDSAFVARSKNSFSVIEDIEKEK